MRNIKFIAYKDGKKRSWEDILESQIYLTYMSKERSDRNDILCQFSSFYDIDNNEIYEGDILRLDDSYFEDYGESGIVIFNKIYGDWCIILEDSDRLGFTNREGIKHKIIGNIHEKGRDRINDLIMYYKSTIKFITDNKYLSKKEYHRIKNICDNEIENLLLISSQK